MKVMWRIEFNDVGCELVIGVIMCGSKSSLRQDNGSNKLRLVSSGLGCGSVSTSRGVFPDRAGRAACIGGEILCTVF